jgi:hypothetical protein
VFGSGFMGLLEKLILSDGSRVKGLRLMGLWWRCLRVVELEG